MRDEHKYIRNLLQEWGAWQRQGIGAMGYPKKVTAFDPTNYEYIVPGSPSWNVKRISPDRETRYKDMKQRSSTPSFQSRTPFYMPHRRLNILDNRIEGLPKRIREVLNLKFVDELTIKEVATMINRAEVTVKKRLESAYSVLSKV